MENTALSERFKQLIQSHCGMMITEVHSQQLEKYLSEKLSQTGKSLEELYDFISSSKEEMINLINAVVVNETYFFREEKQFQFLQKYLMENFNGKEVVIWSAACSTGEEPYSLASLALSCNAKPVVYATDIDTDALFQLKNGVYGFNSFRKDGECFSSVLKKYTSEFENPLGQKFYSISPDLKEKILCSRANLLDLDSSYGAPKCNSVDIIFIRNVFIYFNVETRNAILKSLAQRLKNGGLLFFSISEIAGINPDTKEIPLKKQSQSSIYYLVKNETSNIETVKTQTVVPLLNNNSKEERPSQSNNGEKSRREEYLEELKKQISAQKMSLEQNANFQQREQPFTQSSAADSKDSLPSGNAPTLYQNPEDLWAMLISFTEKKEFHKAHNLINEYKPSVKNLFVKYYAQAFLCQTQKNEEDALLMYEKASISNPHLWPAFFQIALLLQNKEDSSSKLKRHNALIKAATILEKEIAFNDSTDKKSEKTTEELRDNTIEENHSDRYNYLMGTFSSNYFYQLCNDYLKKEFS
ncbi:MAG: hypothetical protein MJ188_08680 [Treponema sp.]|nr:hypothetical protein [Treponema sp.]